MDLPDRAADDLRILEASQKGELEQVRELLAKNPELAGAKGEHDKTPLHWAAERNDEALAALLFASDANIEARTNWGATPLEWAASMGSLAVAELLLARGAQGMNLWIAAALGKESLVETFLVGGAPAPRSAREGEAVASWPADSAFMKGDAISDAFYIACRNGHTRVAERLLDRGASVDARGFFGGSALHWAAQHGHAETVEMLARRGADLSIRDHRFASTAAGWAVEGGHHAIATRLVELGARVTIWEAANYGNLPAVRSMLDADPALLNARGEWGTALHEAVFFGHRAIIDLLLERGGDVSLRTCRDETALGLAKERGHTEIAALLEASSSRHEL